nr:RHS repeat protein [Eubacterium sp.]
MVNYRFFYKNIFVLLFLMLVVLGCSFKVEADEYEYDENGRVILVTHDDGSCTEYEYDNNGNIISVSTIDINSYDENSDKVKNNQNNQPEIINPENNGVSDFLGNNQSTDSINFNESDVNSFDDYGISNNNDKICENFNGT